MPHSTNPPTPSTSRQPLPSPSLSNPSVPARLRLEVLDVTSTAVALSVFTPPLATPTPAPTSAPSSPAPARPKTTAGSMFRKRAPVISIQLDRQPWPHVAHAGGLSQEGGGRGAETTVIVYGLVPGREYEIGVDVASGGEGEEGEAEHFSLEVETGQEGEQLSAEMDIVMLAVGDCGVVARFELTVGCSRVAGDLRHPDDSDPQIRQDDDSPAPSSPQTASTPTTSNTHTHPTPPHPSSTAPDGPPPPYSPSPSAAASTSTSTPTPSLPAPPAEPQLRALLKKLRASSKRTEGVLNASVSALKKSVDKGIKEDQRARTRIGGLEEAVRRAREGAESMRGGEAEECEERVREAEREEEEARGELGRRKEGSVGGRGGGGGLGGQEQGEEGVGEEVDLAELARELDGLNKMIDELESERKVQATEALRALEAEMGHIEADLLQLDREDAHRNAMFPRGNRSSDSLDRVDPLRAPPPLPVIANNPSGFNLRWRRNQPHQPPLGAGPPPPQQDPRSFGRFFRRNVSDPPIQQQQQQQQPTGPVDFSNAGGRFNAQQYAEQHQWNGMMAVNPQQINPAALGGGGGRGSSRSSSLSRTRPRSGSLNSVHSGNQQFAHGGGYAGTGVGFHRTASNDFGELARQTSRGSMGTPLSPLVPLPGVGGGVGAVAIPGAGGEEGEKVGRLSSSREKEVGAGGSGSAGSGGGASWSRLGTWSQVVGRKEKKSTETIKADKADS